MARKARSGEGKKHGAPPVGCGPMEDTETRACLQGLKLVLSALRKYKTAVARHVVLPPPGQVGDDEVIAAFNRVHCLDALPYLATIWKETRFFVTAGDIAEAGLSSSLREGRPLTRSAIGAAAEQFELDVRIAETLTEIDGVNPRLVDLLKLYPNGPKLSQRATRLIDACELLGLIEDDPEWAEASRKNLRPLRGTAALDAVMREVPLFLLSLICSELEQTENDPDSSTRDEDGK